VLRAVVRRGTIRIRDRTRSGVLFDRARILLTIFAQRCRVSPTVFAVSRFVLSVRGWEDAATADWKKLHEPVAVDNVNGDAIRICDE